MRETHYSYTLIVISQEHTCRECISAKTVQIKEHNKITILTKKLIPRQIITKGDVRKEQPLHRRQQRVTLTRRAEPNQSHNRKHQFRRSAGGFHRYLSGLSMTFFFSWSFNLLSKLREGFTAARAGTQTASAPHGSVWAASAVGMQWLCLPAVWPHRLSSWPHTPVKVVKLWAGPNTDF